MKNQYLMPANSKKSMLYFSLFNLVDLFVLGTGIITTSIAVLSLSTPPLWVLLLAISPLLISGILIFPVPYYHNVLQFIVGVVTYYTEQKKYKWKGWSMKDGEE